MPNIELIGGTLIFFIFLLPGKLDPFDEKTEHKK